MTMDLTELLPRAEPSGRRRRRRRTRGGRGKAAEEQGEGAPAGMAANDDEEEEVPAGAASGQSPFLGPAQVVRVKRELLVACMTCPLCRKLLRDATTISECLHTFCRRCIYEKLTDEEVGCCPICNIDLGCTPVEKLRPDHNLQDVRAKIFPFKGRKVKAPEAKPSISLPIRRKERSLSSLFVSTPRVATQNGLTGRTTKIVTRKSSALRGLVIVEPIKKGRANAEDHQETSSPPERLSKTAQNKRISPMQSHQVMQLKRMLDTSANTAPSFTLRLPVCTVSSVATGVVDPPVISHAVDKTVPSLNETSLREAALRTLPEGQGAPTHNMSSTEPLMSGLLAEASAMQSPAQIVEKSPSEAALHVESTLVGSEDRIAERVAESMATNTEPIDLESTPGNIPPSISEKGPSSAVGSECTAMSSNGAPEAPRSFPALGIEWPNGPQFGVMLGSPEVAAQLIQGLDLLLQVDPLLTVEAMRSRLTECTRGYHAFGLPRDAWMTKLVALWNEFAHLHAIQEQKQRIHMMIQQEEEQLCRLQATRAKIYTQAEAARERGWRASLRVVELQRELQKAQEKCSSALAEVETLQCRLDGLQGEVILRKTRIANLRKCEPRSWSSRSNPRIG